ncbi:NAD(P)-dependent oxidoreductase [Bartonella henselae]
MTALAILQKNIEIINSEFFKKMKKNGILVNTARSKLE